MYSKHRVILIKIWQEVYPERQFYQFYVLP